jgi:hypothetical protein
MGTRGRMMGDACFHIGSKRTGPGSEKTFRLSMAMVVVVVELKRNG